MSRTAGCACRFRITTDGGTARPLEAKLASIFAELERRADEDGRRDAERRAREEERQREAAERAKRERLARIEQARAERLADEVPACAWPATSGCT